MRKIEMRKLKGMMIMIALLLSIVAIPTWSPGVLAGLEKVRQPGVAGSFYPADPQALTAMMDDLLARAAPTAIPGQILAVAAPHAGYPYSGPIAAYTYAALKGRSYKRVVVIAPSHYEAFSFTSVYDGDGYATPLGTVAVDKEFARKLAKTGETIRLSGRGHEPTSRGAEHALEVQLPWLQRVLGNFELVPVVMGDQSYESSRDLGTALAKLIRDNDTLIVASSDLSHYHAYKDAVRMDQQTLHAVEKWDYLSMSRNFEMRVWEACGGGPIVTAMIAAERMGATQAKVMRYANSGDTSGDRSRVVGYGAVALVKADAGQVADEPFSLTADEKKQLLSIARTSVEHAVRQGKVWEPAEVTADALNAPRGAFVTLREGGELRGCIGYTSAAEPLYLTVRDTAALAALRDPRFHAVTEPELPRLQYEISVLSPLRRVRDVREIQIGQHGLLMKNGSSEGLLLPQVPVEQGWDRTHFLEQTCVKAGMQRDCWQDHNTDIFLFTALVFSENRSQPDAPPGATSKSTPPETQARDLLPR
ncbi:AmmeMemoRadiSam system protein B [Occallatibacter riparius]|uniref:MEMO1 family protein MOP44_23965 n=1 Tax=Occallatibacter riparius TaxID=1002689 RepID=A0A9J7BPD4_9BACT|nr:AmmeMemoRadiSam system protein B [Occallatibacter riparius]UWZ83610.1 AmmeMemoRadiSam system protein B [Occallatibacter riparius]